MAQDFNHGAGGSAIKIRKRITFTIVSIAAICLGVFLTTSCLSGCSPIYVMQAAYEEGKILLGREEISELVKDQDTDPEIRKKLQLVMRARNFAEQIGLTAKESFTQYSHVDKDVLAWVLLACKQDAFEPYTWWYPIVGTVPYKGFFAKEDAACSIEQLQREGYEIWLRGTEAFSTLGWFNDPILTTTLKHPPYRVANTVIHEIFHQTVWIPGSVDFNESVANVVGGLGSIDFFEQELSQCQDEECKEIAEERLEAARKDWVFEKDFAAVLTELKSVLEELYGSDIPREEKLEKRKGLFADTTKEFLERYPKVTVLNEPNNAALLQLFIYRRELPRIEQLFERCNAQWSCFLDAMKGIAEAEVEDPYTILDEYPK